MRSSHLHGFNPHPTHADYEVCESCGSMHRRTSVGQHAYTNGYWDRPGYSTLEDQVHNVSVHTNEHGQTKMEAILQHAGTGDAALEIACAPGSLLVALHERYKHVVGIECDASYRTRMMNIVQGHAALVFGQFPAISQKWPAQSYDFICGMDVMEHIDDGEAFMGEILRLLKPGGTVALMMPMLDGEDPRPEDLNEEHVWLYSKSYLEEWFGQYFPSVQTGRWVKGHEWVVGKM